MRTPLVALLLASVLSVAGCKTRALEPEWRPLTKLVERPSLPGVSDTATTTVGSKVYTEDLDKWLVDYPPGSYAYSGILIHEREHSRRQFRYKGLPGELAKWSWISRYLNDAEFMLEEEQIGFEAEIKYLQSKGAWTTNDTLRTAANMAKGYKTLGGKRMISFEEAKRWIEDVLSGKWKAPE